jgi:hypothetical protein
MNPDTSVHLNEDQIIRAVVDGDNLPRALRTHLSECPQCTANKEKIESDLARLGRMAERFSPSPEKKVLLPAEKPKQSIWWSWQWHAAFGAAAAAVFVIFVMGITPFFRPAPGGKDRTYTEQMAEAESFMTEVDMLAKNALSQEYMDIAGESDEEPDEEFMDFLIPIIEDESLSHDSGRIGGKQC